jgi:GNAT superfamily N-acetyltransferase
MYQYKSLSLSDHELQQTLSLLKMAWPETKKLTFEYTKWLYRKNPCGRAIGVNAWHDDQLAGHYTVIPVQVKIDGEIVLAALSLHTVIHPNHQGKGLFTKLAEQTYDLAKSQDADHVFGIANYNSTHGFINRLEFQLVSPLQSKILFRLPQINEDNQVETGWERFWNTEMFKWRISSPSLHYSCYRHGNYSFLYGGPVYGLPLIMKIDKGFISQHELQSALKHSKPKLWIGMDPNLKHSKWSISIPDRLKKSPFNLIFRSLKQPGRKLDKNRVKFEAIDFDSF